MLLLYLAFARITCQAHTLLHSYLQGKSEHLKSKKLPVTESKIVNSLNKSGSF